MPRSVAERCEERKTPCQFFSARHTQRPPHRGRCWLRVARRQQQLYLVGLQPPGGLLATRPPHKPSLRQPLLRQPKSLAIVRENANRSSPSAAEHKQAARKGVLPELLL